MTLRLNADEVEAIRRCGGCAYLGLITFHRGRRGARYRPVRTHVFRTPEGAARALAGLGEFATPVARREVVLVDTTGAYERLEAA